ncbi:MAG: glycosyltransferase, partial [Burkholderiaceae bacterium]|nr:glycosyltransferase [Burkholderiaceae bacterium]
RAPENRTAYWKERLADSNSPRIGLAWAGNPLHKNDRNRSTSLSTLAPLWARGNRNFLSLQKDVRRDDAALLKETAAIDDLSSFLTDFAETAAIVSCLDLLITVDSSLAHLAGALDVPVWIMLPHLADFRWLMEVQDSPWYPSARLFRQRSHGDWTSVVDAIDAALAERFGAACNMAGAA